MTRNSSSEEPCTTIWGIVAEFLSDGQPGSYQLARRVSIDTLLY